MRMIITLSKTSEQTQEDESMKGRTVTWVFLTFGLLLSPCHTASSADETFIESVVIFNTICAKCHEAQCSGRLSFDDAMAASSNHILRHYGEASGKQWLQKELFEILNYMKERCAYYPMNTPVPVKRVWGSDILDKLSTLLEKNYFIPVGNFTPGSYRIELELEKDARVTAHLITEDFDLIVEDCYESKKQRINIPFVIESSGIHYFRIYPRKPVRITRLSISTLNE